MMHTYNQQAGLYGICQTCGNDIEWHITQSYAAIAALREAMGQTPILNPTPETEHRGWQIKPQSCKSNGRWCPKALVRIVEGRTSHMQITPDRMFATMRDADAYAIETAKELIDDHGHALAWNPRLGCDALLREESL